MESFVKNKWIKFSKLEKINNKFYLDNNRFSGLTIIKDICLVCEKEYVSKKLSYFVQGVCPSCKRKKTNINKYGVDNPAKSKKIKEIIGSKNKINNKKLQVQKKYKKTMMHRYGVNHNSKSKELQDKKKENYLKKHGVTHHMKRDEIKQNVIYKNKKNNLLAQEKRKQTNLDRYGVKYVWQSKTIKDKIKNTNLERYGVEYPMAFNEDKFKQNIFNKYGVEYYNNSKKTKKTILYNSYKNFNKLNIKPLFTIEEYQKKEHKYDKFMWKCLECKTEFENYFANGNIPKCPICNPKLNGYSQDEKKLSQWCSSFTTVVENDRKLISPYEVDIYLPDYNLAIEYNGLYWHSNKFIDDKWYHQKKVELAYRKGVRLLHIWEHEDEEDVKQSIQYYLENDDFIEVEKPKLYNIHDNLIWI